MTGSNNVAIGYSANWAASNLSNTVVIGSDLNPSASNQVRLGNDNITSLFCKGAYAATTTNPSNLYVDANGQIMRSTVNNNHTQLHAMTSATDHSANPNKMFYSDNAGAINEIPLGDEGKLLMSNGPAAAPSWMSETDTITKVMLLTQLQRDSIPDPTMGMLVYNLDDQDLNFYNGTMWMGFAGSNSNFPPAAPVAGEHVATSYSITWNWDTIPNAAGFRWNSVNDYSSTIDLGLCNSKIDSALNCNDSQTRYIWAYNCFGNSHATTFTQATANTPPAAPAAGTHEPAVNQIIWHWSSVPGASGYKWNHTDNYITAIDNGDSTSFTETGLSCGAPSTLYVWSYSACGNSSATTLSATTLANPTAPVGGVNELYSRQIIWKWDSMPGAAGYKWSETNDYGTAEDLGNTTSKTQTGLTPGTSYSCYVWTNSSCGNSSATTLTGTTNASFTCGEPFTREHVAGNVAPVSATITYGTAWDRSNYKCWITQNLGAIHQADSMDDMSDASAGWYWIWKRPQGYTIDVVNNITPETYWDTLIEGGDNVSNWSLADDPCRLLLGGMWRLPGTFDWTMAHLEGWDPDLCGGSCSYWDIPYRMHLSGRISELGIWMDLGKYGGRGSFWSKNNRIIHTTDLSVPYNSYRNGLSVRCVLNPSIDSTYVTTPVNNMTLINLSQTGIFWKWNGGPGGPDEIHFKWNYYNNYEEAFDLGTTVYYQEENMTPNTTYTRYVWAYNFWGYHSEPLIMTETTLP
jgi:hypothetical protein